MTVSYTAKVATCKRFGCFWKLLFVWKGSIYKLLWPNLIAYFVMYSALSLCYRFLLNAESRTTFEMLSIHCQKYGELIPVSFVLGFYVTIVVSRWWDQYTSIPWPDSLAIFVSSFIYGMDDQSRLMRRTIMRYANLSLVMVFTMICPAAKKRFPTLDHLQEAGFLLPNEKKIFIEMESRTKHPKYWLPLAWATAIVNEARRDDLIKDDFGLKTLINAIIKFRSGCGNLLNYDWISIPLVYTQVVTLAVYTYFMATLMGNQYLDPTKQYPNHTIDLVVPIFTLLQFFFYMGWLLVAETLVNPFGEDDDDFEVNWLIDRNLQISYLIVDEVHENHPALMKDAYWEEVVPDELPYTEAAKTTHHEPFMGSTQYVDVPMDQRNFILMSMLAESEEMSIKTVVSGTGDRKETAPVEIISTAKGDHKVVTSSGRKVSPSSANSVMRLLKANIYRSRTSVKSIESGGDETRRSKRFRKHSIVSATSRPDSSDSFSIRKDSADYLEDIFRMSDFSMRGSSCKVIAGRKGNGNRGETSGAPSENLESLNSHADGLGSFYDNNRRNMNYDVGRMTSWIENTNPPFSSSFEKLGASFGDRSCSIKGQGEMYMGDFAASRSDVVDGVLPRGFDKDANQKDTSHGLNTFGGNRHTKYSTDQEEQSSVEEAMVQNEDAHEMIVPLDEQILLYSNCPSAADASEDGLHGDTDQEADLEQRHPQDDAVSATLNQPSRHAVCKEDHSGEIVLRADSGLKKDISEESTVFEKPQSRAIDIPGSATESKEHRCLPVILRDEETSDSKTDQSRPELEESLLSRDPLAQPQPEVVYSATSQVHLDPPGHEPRGDNTAITIPLNVEDQPSTVEF